MNNAGTYWETLADFLAETNNGRSLPQLYRDGIDRLCVLLTLELLDFEDMVWSGDESCTTQSLVKMITTLPSPAQGFLMLAMPPPTLMQKYRHKLSTIFFLALRVRILHTTQGSGRSEV